MYMITVNIMETDRAVSSDYLVTVRFAFGGYHLCSEYITERVRLSLTADEFICS